MPKSEVFWHKVFLITSFRCCPLALLLFCNLFSPLALISLIILEFFRPRNIIIIETDCKVHIHIINALLLQIRVGHSHRIDHWLMERNTKINYPIYYIYSVFCTGCSLNTVFFSLKFCDFSDLCQFCCSAGFLPAWCVYTHRHREKIEKGQSLEYFKVFGKKYNT